MRTEKVYLVTEGQYSDYGIVAIFAKLELAEAYLERMIKAARSSYHEFNEIETHELYWKLPVIER